MDITHHLSKGSNCLIQREEGTAENETNIAIILQNIGMYNVAPGTRSMDNMFTRDIRKAIDNSFMNSKTQYAMAIAAKHLIEMFQC